MRKYYLLLFIVSAVASFAIKPENVVSSLRTGMSPDEVRKICDAEQASQFYKKEQTRFFLYNFYTTDPGLLVEYKFQFFNEGLISGAKRNSKNDDWAPIEIAGESMIQKLIDNRNTNFQLAPYDIDEALEIFNSTLMAEKFTVLVSGASQHWTYIGTTPMLSVGESYKFKFYLAEYPLYTKPLHRVAVLASSGRLLYLVASKDDDDLRVSVMEEKPRGVDSPTSEPKQESTQTTSPQDIKSKLQILKELYDDGLISKQEYNEKRQKLLDSL